ncbi:MAG: DUF3568 family protein [Solirubrobacterales bacterium]
MRRLTITATLIAAGCLLCPGCAPTYRDPATGTEAWYDWETLRAKLDEPISTAYAAARDAAGEFDLRTLRCDLDGISAEIVALDAQVETVYIRLEALPESRSLLTIRVGLFGSKNKSIVLFSKIMEELDEQVSEVPDDP